MVDAAWLYFNGVDVKNALGNLGGGCSCRSLLMILQSSKSIRGLPLIFSSSVIQMPKIQGKYAIFRGRGGGGGRGPLLTANSEKNRIWAYSWGFRSITTERNTSKYLKFHRTNILKPNYPKQRPYPPHSPEITESWAIDLQYNRWNIMCIFASEE